MTMIEREISHLLQSAMHSVQNGNIESARELCNKVIQIDSDQPDALHLLGKISESQNDLRQAIAYYKQSLESDTNSNIYMSMAILYQQGEEYSLAIDNYKSALELSPGIDIALQGIHQCGVEGHIYDKALEAINTIATSSPSIINASIHYLQLFQSKVDYLIDNNQLELAIDNLILLIQDANFLPVSFLSSKKIVANGGITGDIVQKHDGIEEIMLLSIVALGYEFNNMNEDAISIVTIVLDKLSAYIECHPEDNRAWRLLSSVLNIYKDKVYGNSVLRDFLGNLSDSVIIKYYI